MTVPLFANPFCASQLLYTRVFQGSILWHSYISHAVTVPQKAHLNSKCKSNYLLDISIWVFETMSNLPCLKQGSWTSSPKTAQPTRFSRTIISSFHIPGYFCQKPCNYAFNSLSPISISKIQSLFSNYIQILTTFHHHPYKLPFQQAPNLPSLQFHSWFFTNLFLKR